MSMIGFIPTTKYAYNVPQISSGGETKSPKSHTYTIPHMIEYIITATSALDRINRIHYCGEIKEMTEADREDLHKKVAYIYVYHHTVHNDKNFNPKDLEYWLPEYSNYINQCVTINTFREKFKSLPDIAPLFNGTGCFIM